MEIPKRKDFLRGPDAEKNAARVKEYIRERQTVLLALNPYKSEVTISLFPEDLPLKVNHVGDTHDVHDSADPDGLDDAIAQTGDGLMITQGNIIEGQSNKFMNTNTIKIALGLNDQVANARVKLGRVRGQWVGVGKNFCHEGWADKVAGYDPLRDIADETTPLIYSGGQIIFKDGLTTEDLGRIEAYHNAGSGRTQQSPEGSTRARSREVPVGHPDRPTMVADAHMHRLVAGQDVIRNPIIRKDVTTSLGEVGTAKGSRDNPDEFLVGRVAVPPRNQPGDAGRGLVSIWRRGEEGEKLNCYPVADYDRANLLYDAMKLWDNASGTAGTLEDLVGMIQDDGRFPAPEVTLEPDKSIIAPQEVASKSEGSAPLYKTVAQHISTTLPVSVQFIGNTRIGSNSFDRKGLGEVLEDINKDDWAFYVATRRLVNQGTAKRGDRDEVLADLADTLDQADSSLLGIMLTDDLRHNDWSKDLIVKEEGDDGKMHKVTKERLLPGDWLYYESPVAGTPLLQPETVMRVDTPEADFTLYVRDKLSHFTSLINPAHGLTRVAEVWGIAADALVGGHTEQVGWRTWMRPTGQLEVVVPGGFAEFVEKGIGSRVDYPAGGQGIVLVPEPRAVYSFASHQDGKDMHKALWVQEGLRQMGKLDEVREDIAKKK
ncbi:MAG: hypothetical protein Q7S31_02935 [bacterium]|nr:hypothetical protein [bacterium]